MLLFEYVRDKIEASSEAAKLLARGKQRVAARARGGTNQHTLTESYATSQPSLLLPTHSLTCPSAQPVVAYRTGAGAATLMCIH